MAHRLNLSTSYMQERSLLHDRSVLSNPGWNDLKFDPMDYVRPELTIRDIEIYKEIFDCFDTQRAGSLMPFDLRKAFINCGYKIPRKLVYQIISDFDGDESGHIDFHEFVNMMTMTPCEQDDDEAIKRVFEQFAGKKEYIEKGDLKLIVDEMNEAFKSDKEKEAQLTVEEMNEIFHYFQGENDKEHNEKITWEQFRDFNKKFKLFNKDYKKFIQSIWLFFSFFKRLRTKKTSNQMSHFIKF